MGCGSSSHVIPAEAHPDKASNGTVATNGHGKELGHDRDQDYEDLPTVVLPESPAKPKPPIAFDIPVEELGPARRAVASPPPHLQRLLQPIQPDLTLPDIQGKLAEAENRRQMILQQRAASAQRRTQKMLKSLHEMDRLDSDHELMEPEINKHVSTNTLKIPQEPAAWGDRNI